jgi:CobQ-like glutamine amidotransferase family enzyme
VGGGQDREQALIAPDFAAKGERLRESGAGAAVLAVCGGYHSSARSTATGWERAAGRDCCRCTRWRASGG